MVRGIVLGVAAACTFAVGVREVVGGVFDSMRKEMVCVVAADAAVGKVVASAGPGGCHLAYTKKMGSRFMVVDDSQGEEVFDLVENESLTFSPDGKRLAYVAGDQKGKFVVVDGKAGERFEEVDWKSLTFSADGSHLAYAAREGDRWFVVYDGKRGSGYARIVSRPIVLSRKGARVGYVAETGGKCVAVVDGKESPGYWEIDCLQFTGDGKHAGFEAEVGDGAWRVVVDGAATDIYEDVGGLVLVEGRGEPVFAAKRGGKWYVVSGKEGGAGFDAIGESTPLVSSDGKRVVYSATVGKKWVVVDKGTKSAAFDWALHDGLLLTGDGKHLAYMMEDGGKQYVVKDGVMGKAFEGVGDGALVFSPDGKRFAFGAKVEGKAYFFVDGEKGRVDGVGKGTFSFSLDCRHYAYVGGAAKNVVVLDGEASPVGGRVICKPAFRGDGQLEWLEAELTQDAAAFYRVTVPMK